MTENNIKFLVIDVDGTLTDGKINMGAEGEVFKAFDVKDGCGIKDILPDFGIDPVIITARESKHLEKRCKELGISLLYQGVRNKYEKLNLILQEQSLRDGCDYSLNNVAYIGDDLLDLQCMVPVKEAGGLVGCPRDAVDRVKDTSDFVSSRDGGSGAVREFIDWICYRENNKKKKRKIELDNKVILVTGAAGFIGAGLVKQLMTIGLSINIVGIDSLNNYYDVNIKEFRLKEIEKYVEKYPGCKWNFIKGNIADKQLVTEIFDKYKPQIVVNLAAQAGVRYSILNPDAYIESNIIGFYNILEACRHSFDNGSLGVEHLVYASSSSVYGSNKKVPYSTEDKVDNPVSLYAATKKSNELMAHAYSKLYNIPSTGLRFFTVYGPAGRPDMAYFGFTDKLRKNEKIQIFNYGNCKRDFTYIDDIVKGIIHVMQGAPEKKAGEDGLPVPPYEVYNIGNNSPENLLEFVDILQQELIRAGVLPCDYDFESHKELVPMQPGDVPVTYADTSALERDFGFKPSTPLRTGLRKFAEWYREFYIK